MSFIFLLYLLCGYLCRLCLDVMKRLTKGEISETPVGYYALFHREAKEFSLENYNKMVLNMFLLKSSQWTSSCDFSYQSSFYSFLLSPSWFRSFLGILAKYPPELLFSCLTGWLYIWIWIFSHLRHVSFALFFNLQNKKSCLRRQAALTPFSYLSRRFHVMAY